MNLRLTLPDDVAQRLQAAAAQRGIPAETLVAAVLRDCLSLPMESLEALIARLALGEAGAQDEAAFQQDLDAGLAPLLGHTRLQDPFAMAFTVVFEHWHLGDRNYPAFAVGDEARLAFELDPRVVESVEDGDEERVEQLGDAEYQVVGRVLRQYPDGIRSTFPVLSAAWLRCYCPHSAAARLPVGTMVRLVGRLALDHYRWALCLDQYPDPPDLFYGVRVTRVRDVRIPARFIRRPGRSVSYPAAVSFGAYAPEDVVEVGRVGGSGVDPAFSLLDLVLLPPGAGPAHPTFIRG